METPPKLDPPQQNRATAIDGLEHVEALVVDPHFAWFVKEVLEAARDSEQAKALDLAKTPEERTAACHRLALARDLCDALEKKRRLWSKAVDRA